MISATPTTPLVGGMRKFVDRLPGLGLPEPNNIIQAHGAGQYIPIAVADTTPFRLRLL